MSGVKLTSEHVTEDLDPIAQLVAGTLGLFDKRGIPIERGDVVKVSHFIGARRKRHFMYKQCLGFKGIGPEGKSPYMKFGHLNLVSDDADRDAYYLMRPDGSVLEEYEIIQSIKCDHERRPRLALSQGGGE